MVICHDKIACPGHFFADRPKMIARSILLQDLPEQAGIAMLSCWRLNSVAKLRTRHAGHGDAGQLGSNTCGEFRPIGFSNFNDFNFFSSSRVRKAGWAPASQHQCYVETPQCPRKLAVSPAIFPKGQVAVRRPCMWRRGSGLGDGDGLLG